MMSLIINKDGISVELRNEMALRDKAMSGDLVLVVSPATLGSSAEAVNGAIGGTAEKFVRTVVVELKTAGGLVHTWFDGTFGIGVADTSAGTSAIAGSASTVALVNGRGSVVIEYTGTWSAEDTCTLTVTGATKMGYTIANKTSVDTLVA
jgi:hypothetical protein